MPRVVGLFLFLMMRQSGQGARAAQVREPLVVTEYVLCETVDALSLPADRAKAQEAMKQRGVDPAAGGSRDRAQAASRDMDRGGAGGGRGAV